MKFVLLLLVIGFVIFLYLNETTPSKIGIKDGRLNPCPKSPNCISSNAVDTSKQIDPIPIVDGNELHQIEEFFKSHYIARVAEKKDNYLHIVVSTPFFHFKDDLEFLVNEEDKIISIRSASRVGYSDMGVNRERIEKLQEYLKE